MKKFSDIFINLHKLITLLLIIFCTGCVKEVPKKRIDRQQEALRSCRESVFIGNITSKSNFLSLMRCLGWNRELPNLYRVIEDVGADDWNFITKPIDEEFFYKKSAAQRDKLFSFLYQSNSNGQLKRIDNYLKTMSVKNLLLILKLALKCDSKCSNKVYSKLIPTGSSVVSFFESFLIFYNEANKKGLVDNLYQRRSVLLDDKSFEYFVTSLVNDFSDTLRHPAYENLIGDGLGGILSPPKNRLFGFLESFNSQESYLSWTEGFIRSLPDLARFSILLKNNDGKVQCEGNFNADLFPKVNSLLLQVKDNSFKNLTSYLLDDFALISFANQSCPGINFSKKKIRFLDYIENGFFEREKVIDRSLSKLSFDVARVLDSPDLYDLLSTFLKSGNYNQGDLKSFIDLLGKPTTLNALNYLKYIKNKNNPIYLDLLALVYFMPVEFINTLGDINFYLKEQSDVRELISHIGSEVGGNEVGALITEFNKLLEAFESPDNLLNFGLNALSLSSNLFDRYKKSIYSDEYSIKKLNNLYDKLYRASESLSFEREFSAILSSRYLIKAARLIGRGVVESSASIGAVFSSNRLDFYRTLKKRNYIPKLLYKPDSGLLCLEKISKKNNFVEILNEVQRECAEILTQDSVFNLLQDVSFFYSDFSKYKTSFNSERSVLGRKPLLFSKNGILNENIFKNTIILLKNYKQDDSRRNQNVFNGLIEFVNKHMSLSRGSIGEFFNSSTRLANKLIDSASDGELRNLVLSSVLERLPKDGGHFKNNLSRVLDDIIIFSQIEAGQDLSDRERFACDNYFSNPVGHNRCQKPVEIKKRIKRILYYLVRKNGINRPTALQLLTKALSPEEKFEIQFSRETIKYQLTFSETLNFLVDINDPNYKYDGEFVNKKPIEMFFVNNNKKYSKTFSLLTGDRLEAVVREVRFDGNYLGVHYMNSVASSDEYVEVIKGKYKLLKVCGVYLRYCLRTFTKQEYAMLRNGVNTYPSLWETESIFGYGKFIKTLLVMLVDSSSERAAKAATVKVGKFEMPYMQSNDELKEHNGRMLSEVSYLASFSNLFRVLERSFGNIDKIREYSESGKFNFISENIFSEIEPAYFEEILKSLIFSLEKNQYRLVDKLVDRIYSLDDKHIVKLENLIHNLLYLMSYLPYESKENHLKFLLDVIAEAFSDERIIDYLISDEIFYSLVNIIQPSINFIVQNLEKPGSGLYDDLVDQGISLLDEFELKLLRSEGLSIVEYLSNFIKDDNRRGSLTNFINTASNLLYSSEMQQNKNIEAIKEISFFLNNSGSSFDKLYSNILSSVYFSTLREICQENSCEANNHYDELFELLGYLSNGTNFINFIDYFKSDKFLNSSIEFSKLIESVEIIE